MATYFSDLDYLVLTFTDIFTDVADYLFTADPLCSPRGTEGIISPVWIDEGKITDGGTGVTAETFKMELSTLGLATPCSA